VSFRHSWRKEKKENGSKFEKENFSFFDLESIHFRNFVRKAQKECGFFRNRTTGTYGTGSSSYVKKGSP
jgi:hypothetical protein